MCYVQKQCWGPWLMLPLTVRNKEATFTMISISNYRCTVEREGHGRLLGQPLPPQKVTGYTESHWRELFKSVTEMLKSSTSQLMTSGVGAEGHRESLSGRPQRVWPSSGEYIDNTGLFYYCYSYLLLLLWGRSHWGVDRFVGLHFLHCILALPQHFSLFTTLSCVL